MTRSYDPHDFRHRQDLAHGLKTMLDKAGFTPVTIPGTRERVYAREVPNKPQLRVLVYTSIVNGEVRKSGKDAIRACVVYRAKDGRERGVASAEKRVNRSGSIASIVERTLGRMREVYRMAGGTLPTCPDCGAPQFKAKKSGRLVCADLCWKTRPSTPSRGRQTARSGSRPSAPSTTSSAAPVVHSAPW